MKTGKTCDKSKFRNFAILWVALLAGCAGAPVPAPQTVEIPVVTPCVKMDIPRPDFEFGKLILAASEGEKVLALARDWPRARKYEGALEAVIEGCR